VDNGTGLADFNEAKEEERFGSILSWTGACPAAFAAPIVGVAGAEKLASLLTEAPETICWATGCTGTSTLECSSEKEDVSAEESLGGDTLLGADTGRTGDAAFKALVATAGSDA
jgi:hypothetical protein